MESDHEFDSGEHWARGGAYSPSLYPRAVGGKQFPVSNVASLHDGFLERDDIRRPAILADETPGKVGGHRPGRAFGQKRWRGIRHAGTSQ